MKQSLKNFLSGIIVMALIIAITVCPVIATAEEETYPQHYEVQSSYTDLKRGEFYFNTYNLGGHFNVAQRCNATLVISALAMDGNGGTIDVQLLYGMTDNKMSINIPATGTPITVHVNNLPAGGYNFIYTSDRDVQHYVAMAFYATTY